MGLSEILPFIVPLVLLAALIFRIPELGLVLCLVIGSLLKGIVQPLLGPIDVTVYLFAVTYGSIFIRCCMERKLALPDLRINIGVLLLVALLLGSLLYTPLPRQGTETFLRFILLTVSIMYAAFMWCTNIDRVKRLLFIFIGVVLAYGTAAFIWVFLMGHGLYPGSRAPFAGTPVLGVSQLLAAAIPTAFILRGFASSKHKRLVLNLLMTIAVVELIALNSRGPVIAFLAGGVCLFLLCFPKEKRRLVFLASVALPVVVLVFILLPSQYTGRFLLMTSLESASIGERLNMSQFVLGHFSDWFLAGSGISGFGYHYYGPAEHPIFGASPHNIFLDIFAHVGFFGLLAFVWLIVSAAHKGTRISRTRDQSFHLLGLASVVPLIVFLVAGLFSMSLITTRPLWFFVGLILSLERPWMKRDKESATGMLEVKE